MSNLFEKRKNMLKSKESEEEKANRLEENEENNQDWDKMKTWDNKTIFEHKKLVLQFNHYPGKGNDVQIQLKNAIEWARNKSETIRKNDPEKLIWKTSIPEQTCDEGDVFMVAFRNPQDLLVFKSFCKEYINFMLQHNFHLPISLVKTPMEKDKRSQEQWQSCARFPCKEYEKKYAEQVPRKN